MSSSATAPWKQLLLKSLSSNSHLKHSTYFQLATVGSNGRPSNRTVVFRGFQDGTNKIQINTDSRSRKIEELKHCPFAEVCWYFTETWEQFRIHGRVDMIDASNSDPDKLKQREAAWFAGSVRSRLQYLGLTPGIPSLDEQPSHDSLDPSAGPVDAFCLLILDPEKVDYLNLKSNDRLSFTAGQSVNVPDEINQLNLKHMRTKVPHPNL
ncbi:pyridoxine/pyridoxamine 5'-phosphate oxidase 2 [Nicotiana tabacum]|uniref:pyridoxal 5'-phosphate synthase n=2 Tax=Nicotiana TaxID=4085 RepID=A0A1S3X115_TOBAC|nr:PREDICTED: pyridoxine/pyridoxamine 5'-phosphate oxidase 2 [Nicotiana sylvestris]XP_016433612.1 PREDICTED: pyridoxine/pyridoxamine 5'-phosphate oxidase 2-like [Nicotiana tabacum]